LRNPADFEFEKSHSAYQTFIPNRNCIPYSGKNILHCSSIVRDVLRNGGEYEKLVPSKVLAVNKTCRRLAKALSATTKNKNEHRKRIEQA
jgi:phosphopantetheine adenylyltransferase